MSTRWERFSGETSTFAVRLSFKADPDEGSGSDPDTAASWGSIQIWVDGINICAHADQGETLETAHWYLLPILEWLASSWDPLFHEERLPLISSRIEDGADLARATPALLYADVDAALALNQDKQRYEWEQRHSLRAARDGGVIPDFRLRRLRDWLEISWDSAPLAGAADVEFLAPTGRSYKEPAIVAQPLYEVLHDSVQLLRAERPASSRVKALEAAVSEIRSPERSEARTALLAGLNGESASATSRWRLLVDAAAGLARPDAVAAIFGTPAATMPNGLVLEGSCEAALLFGSVSPMISEDDALLLARLLLDSYQPGAGDGLQDLVRDEHPSADLHPWDQGYDLADAVLDRVADELVDDQIEIARFLRDRGVDLTEVALSDEHVRAISFVGPTHAPTIAANKSSRLRGRPSALRFTLAHELCHLLFDRSRGSVLAVASGPWAPKVIEQRANAFAAMLLMPPDLITTAMVDRDVRLDTVEDLRVIATQLGVSVTALMWHSHNVGLIDETTLDDLQAELSTPADG